VSWIHAAGQGAFASTRSLAHTHAQIDRQLLDARSVFKELQLEPEKPTLSTLISEKRRKPKADGYADGRTLMFTRLPASEFVRSEEYVTLLSEASQVSALRSTPAQRVTHTDCA